MHRREVLRAVGVAMAGGLAGCGGASVDDSDGGGSEPTDTPESNTTTTGARTTTEAASGRGAAETTTATPGTPSMGTPELTAQGSGCLSGEAGATVTFGEGEVIVAGTIAAPNPCHRPELSASGYDEGADELSLTVAAVDDAEAGRACVSCTGGLRYTVTVPFENGLPGGVTVTHAGIETATVADIAREK